MVLTAINLFYLQANYCLDKMVSRHISFESIMAAGSESNVWKHLPALLGSLAAVITAAGGIYIALSNGDGSARSAISDETKTPVTPVPKETVWVTAKDETFTTNKSSWYEGKYDSDHFTRADIRIINGKYRWDFEFVDEWGYYRSTPYGPQTDAVIAVDVNFTESGNNNIGAGLVFGRSHKKDFTYKISANGFFNLTTYDEDSKTFSTIIESTPIQLKTNEVNRIKIVIENQVFKFYVNNQQVGAYKEKNYVGGKTGLYIANESDTKNAVVIDFDNYLIQIKQ